MKRPTRPTPKAFPRDRPDATAWNVIATSNVVPVPTATPSGSWSFGRMTGGRGETPQPPAVDVNRFAIGAWRRLARGTHRRSVSGIGECPPATSRSATAGFPRDEERVDVPRIDPAVGVDVAIAAAGFPRGEEGVDVAAVDAAVLIEVGGTVEALTDGDGRRAGHERAAVVGDPCPDPDLRQGDGPLGVGGDGQRRVGGSCDEPKGV